MSQELNLIAKLSTRGLVSFVYICSHTVEYQLQIFRLYTFWYQSSYDQNTRLVRYSDGGNKTALQMFNFQAMAWIPVTLIIGIPDMVYSLLCILDLVI